MAQIYNKGTTTAPSTVDKADMATGAGNAQFNQFFYDRQAIVYANLEQFIGQLSSTRNMPKHYGKTIKKHVYIPVMDDRNINDQGIDAAGLTMDGTKYDAIMADGSVATSGTGYVAATATVRGHFATEAAAIAVSDIGVAKLQSGNLIGSSKDIATINAEANMLSETGGRVNRIGFSREEISGTIENYGYFYEFTADDLDFDSDSKLYSHLYREAGKAAGELSEKSLMIDLIEGAGVEVFAGGKTSVKTVAAGDVVDLDDLRMVTKVLNTNKAPTDTQMITGSRNIDTKVVAKARYAYTSDDVVTVLEDMTQTLGSITRPLWHYVEEYADGAKYAKSNVARGEVGKILKTRFIEHPEMVYYEKGGAAKIDVHPILYVGSGSFTQIGFQSMGTKSKFQVIVKKPGVAIADRQNPYGKLGFVSNQWWYGVLIERPDWVATVYTAVA